jgi:hypothetical protein
MKAEKNVENNLTAVDYLISEIEKLITIETFQKWVDLKKSAKDIEQKKAIDELIFFQLYLNDKKLITNYDWDYEEVAKKYIKTK